MKLIIDIGNTRYKLASFDRKELSNVLTINELDSSIINKYIVEEGPFSRCIISSVRKEIAEIAGEVSSHCPVVVLDHHTKIPLLNKYETPETLGKDRLAAAVGAIARYPGQDILVVDAGTAITYEVVTKKGEYLGGGISPGIDLRFKALNTFTGRLPLIERHDHADLLGNNTERSILSGVMNGVLEEVRGIVGRYRQKYPGILVIFTGGDMNYFVSNLKNNIFALPNLVLEGLNEILDIND